VIVGPCRQRLTLPQLCQKDVFFAARARGMFEEIEMELTTIRNVAEKSGDDFLAYLINMAIIQANAKARARQTSLESLISASAEPQKSRLVAFRSPTKRATALTKRPGARRSGKSVTGS
jgi:hypothetical protein